MSGALNSIFDGSASPFFPRDRERGKAWPNRSFPLTSDMRRKKGRLMRFGTGLGLLDRGPVVSRSIYCICDWWKMVLEGFNVVGKSMLKAVLATDGGRGRDPFQPLHPGWPPIGTGGDQSVQAGPPTPTHMGNLSRKLLVAGICRSVCAGRCGSRVRLHLCNWENWDHCGI